MRSSILRSRRRIAACLLATYVWNGCHRTVQVVPEARHSREQIVGAVLLNGSELVFPKKDGVIQGDTLYSSETSPQPLDSVRHILVRRDAPLATFAAVIGVAALGLAAAAGIAVATKESCPFVYSWDGTQWVFDAEPYGGAITRGLERDDYGVLEHLRPVDGEYRLMMVNEVRESQMTDLVRLFVVDHPSDVLPVADEFGRIYSVSRPEPPRLARDQSGTDLVPWLSHPDRLVWETPPGQPLASTRDTVYLTFAKPTGAPTMKLVARVATAAWGSHQIRSLLGLFGTSVNSWYARLDSNPLAADSVRQWSIREGLFGLAIEVREPDGWRIRGALAGGGPFIAEDRVVPLDVSRVRDSLVELRLMPARGFWGLDWFAADFSPQQALFTDTLAVVTAKDVRIGEVSSLLAAADGRYHPLPDTGDRTTLTFRAPSERPGLARTVMLHARGWYHLRDLPTQPVNVGLVDRVFGEPEFAAKLSAEEYRRLMVARRN